MSVCRHRLEEAGSFIACAAWVDGKTRTCICGDEVKAEIEAGKFGIETRVARVPDSARPIELEESA